MRRVPAGAAGFIARRAARFFQRARPVPLGGLVRDARRTGGFSWSPATGRLPTRGYMVATTGRTAQFPESILDDPKAAARAIDRYLHANRDVFENRKDIYLGCWIEDEKMWLEPSMNLRRRTKAVKLARETDQIAIYDVKTRDYINTGGAGGFLEEA
ncbi:hypothetical protein [Sphaerisporangium fuscum]|uniref:hypothetical protein n=1 Tax=Sphaerisporangium fuscum TaxID=2835868 RepID=UPI001BDBC4A6|nr:hypothetical protein [Sphaerisporangium fuscum]